MAALGAILLLLVTLHVSYGYEFINEEAKSEDDLPLPWPETFTVKGETIDLTYGIVENFELWTDGTLNRSRRDAFDGVERGYFYGGNEDESGAAYLISPISQEDNKVEYMCLSFPYEGGADFLPSLEGFEKFGTKRHGSKVLEIWQLLEEDHLKKTEQTMFYHRTFSKDENRYVAEPFQYIKTVLNVQKGSWVKHSITNFYNVEYQFPSHKVNIEEDDVLTEECESYGEITENFKNDVKILKANTPLNLDLLFESYTKHHSKNYVNEEHELRKEIFHANWRLVTEHNRKNLSYRLELNEFADKTDEELAYLTATYPSNPEKIRASPFPHTQEEVENLVQELPREYDLRIEGLISPVKNQASCGSCWAFSAVATLEGALALKNGGRDLDLSEQSLVDCAWGYGNGGCNGGDLAGAMNYVLDKGIPTDREYGPYIAKDGACHRWNATKLYQISGFAKVTPRNVNAMKVAIYKYGPVVAAIHASRKMKMYDNGIFYDVDCNDYSLNHGITVVGYGERDGDLYWIVKNSWGEAWGEDGYILLSANDNNCFLTDEAYFVVA
ncbi:hypothetical protein K1T71_012839 [Dendrolimus kikuchii]|uniref:Uncharacterized protein n=1 Tax=Dendrolimus kikuchii TaxID=765133 RepID=A0ACC1CI87_9NEOP|nr:hypothetical protein K1T71_012839 [Dendrolimus kikuchii]